MFSNIPLLLWMGQDAMRDIYDWDSGEFLGQIKEAAHTYNVVGNTNEKGVIIGISPMHIKTSTDTISLI